VQLLQCIANGGNFTLSFRQAVTEPLSFNSTAEDLQAALSSLSTLRNVLVYFSTDFLPPNGTLNQIRPSKEKPYEPANGIFNSQDGNFVYNVVAMKPNSTVNSTFCRTDGQQVAILSFEYTHGNLPAVQVDTSLLMDFDNDFGAPGSGVINVFQDGESVLGLVSILGTTENALCNNRGLCDTSSGTCACFDDWSSSDGARQGKQGFTGDCGYRNVEHIMTV